VFDIQLVNVKYKTALRLEGCLSILVANNKFIGLYYTYHEPCYSHKGSFRKGEREGHSRRFY